MTICEDTLFPLDVGPGREGEEEEEEVETALGTWA